LDEALEVADLGDAIKRKYNTYSHGMRQRLGIAQALLGRPDLLVLDEPTSGLDPHQMREIREMVRTVSARGTTVLLSSHLLSEVEQVCDRAAVMNKGRLVTVGTVDQLVGATTIVYLEVDDAESAVNLLSRTRGVERVELQGGGITVHLDGLARKDLVAALVHQGIGVETLTARNRLEDAFIDLLEEAPA
ncbi:MAG: AAA family ATPase, partial [Acidimicrobiales bacterium]